MKQISQAIEAEESAIKRVTAEIEKLKVRKNAETTAIRSWRFKYRAWKSRVDIVPADRIMSEDETRLLQQQINAYNGAIERVKKAKSVANQDMLQRNLRSLERRTNMIQQRQIDNIQSDLQATLADIEEARTIVKAYNDSISERQSVIETNQQIASRNNEMQNAYEDETRQANTEYQRKLAQYEEDMQAYKKAQENEPSVVEIVDYLNNDEAEGMKLYSVKNGEIIANESVISELAQYYVQQYDSYVYTNSTLEDMLAEKQLFRHINVNWDGLQELFNDGDNSGVQYGLVRAIQRTVQKDLASIHDDLSKQGKLSERPVKPIKAEVEKPKLLELEEVPEVREVELPAFSHTIENAPIFHENAVSETLVSEMDNYASGPYKRSEEHTEDINALADKIGCGCPKKDVVDKAYDNSDLILALDELESTWEDFGSQRNSKHGASIVDKFKEATKQMRDAHNFDELNAGARKFSTSSTSLMVWLSSNWWQKGGTPTGEAHAWKGMGGLKLGGNLLNL